MTVKDNSTIAITDILTFLKRHTKHIIIFGFLTAFIVATISFLMQPIYRSTATVLIDGRQSNVLDAASIMSGITSDSAVVDSQTEIIKSPVLLDRVANKEKLRNVDYFYTPSQSFLTFAGVFLGIHQPYSENSEPKTQDDVTTENETTNEKIQAITTAETPNNTLQDGTLETESLVMNWLKLVFPEPAPKTEEAIQKRIISKLQDNLSVTRIGKSLVLSISVETTSPSLSKRIVNRITNEYLNDQLETKLQATKRATSWLTERLSDLRTELDSKETAISAFKQANNLFGASGVTQIEQQVSRLNEQLIAAKVETAEKRARYNQVQSLARTGSLQSYSGFVSSGTVSNLRLKESEAVGDVANLSAKYGGNHPQLINAKAKLRDIRKQINQEAGRMVANARSEYNIAQSRESSLRASLNGLKGQFDRTGAKSIQLQKLEREAEAARTAYNAISERFRETDNSDKIQESDARIISLGSAPLDPVKPKKGLLTVVGFILGCLIGTVIAVIRDALSKVS